MTTERWLDQELIDRDLDEYHEVITDAQNTVVLYALGPVAFGDHVLDFQGFSEFSDYLQTRVERPFL